MIATLVITIWRHAYRANKEYEITVITMSNALTYRKDLSGTHITVPAWAKEQEYKDLKLDTREGV